MAVGGESGSQPKRRPYVWATACAWLHISSTTPAVSTRHVRERRQPSFDRAYRQRPLPGLTASSRRGQEQPVVTVSFVDVQRRAYTSHACAIQDSFMTAPTGTPAHATALSR
jgi:hypothetical protein